MTSIRSWSRLRERLRPKLTGATAVVSATVGVIYLNRIISSVVLTRLLDPEAFGVAGIVLSLIFVFGMLSDIGLLPFVVRHKDADDREFLDEVWTIRLLRGFLLTGIMIVLAGPLASYSGKEPVQAVIIAWSFGTILEGFSSMTFATALRHFQVNKLSLMDVYCSIFQLVVQILLSYLLRSYWGLVIGTLLAGGLRMILSYTMFPGSARRFRFSMERFREIWGFSRFIAGSSAVSLIISQTDKLIFARYLSLAEFGIYSIATTLATAPSAIALSFSERVLYPVYAGCFRRDPRDLRQVYYKHKRLVSHLYVLAVGGLIGGSHLVVAILLEPTYQPVAPIVTMLGFAPLLLLNNLSADKLLVATGRTWTTMSANIVRLLWLGAGGAYAAMSGDIRNLIPALGSIELPAMLFYWIVLGRLGFLRVREELTILVTAAVGILIGWATSTFILGLVSI